MADSIAQLKPDRANANKGTVRGRALLEDSLRRYGAGRSILADKHGNVIAGNKTLEASADIGLPVRFVESDGTDLIVVRRTDLDLDTDTAARELAYADNRIAALDLDWDIEQLLADRDAGIDLAAVGFDADELAALLAGIGDDPTEGLTDPDAVPPVPAVPVTKPGDLWTLGRHRLACCDCRDFSAIERLFGGMCATVVVTSPPYASQRAYDESSGFRPIPPDEYSEWFRDVAANIMAILAGDGSYFLNIKEHADEGQRSLYVKDLTIAHVREWGWRLVDEFCWRNTRDGVPGGWPNRFKNAWEPVFHFARSDAFKFRPDAVLHDSDAVFDYSPENAKARSGSGLLGSEKAGGYRSGRARPSNVIEVPAESGQGNHTAPYPVALPTFFLRAFSDRGDVAFDPFGGSGTTLMAAEIEGRIGLTTEISPAYCDVIVTRWQNFTGLRAVRA